MEVNGFLHVIEERHKKTFTTVHVKWCAVISAFDDLGPGDLGPSEVISARPRWSRPVISARPRWSRPVSCPRCEHATTSQTPQAPLHVRRSSPEISPGDLARSLIADTSPNTMNTATSTLILHCLQAYQACISES